jgi:hypothetical protein
MKALRTNTYVTPGNRLDPGILDVACARLAQRFDARHGGFGGPPKFPTPHNLLLLLRRWRRTGEPRALEMTETTLRNMRRGGIYDQLGFGFHRYSTDSEWLVPHFEKMLYDQALLAMAYVETYQATGDEFYARTAGEVLDYVIRDMTGPEGGFYSAEDADSEGEEGRFYVWTAEAIDAALEGSGPALARRVFNVEPGGNFVDEIAGGKTGSNILHLNRDGETLAAELGIAPAELEARLESLRARLFDVRDRRVHPLKDDKVLTDWNGLMIAALAKTGRALKRQDYIDAAGRGAAFILGNMLTGDGTLLHRYRQGDAAIAGHLDDYAFMIWGLMELYQATFDLSYLRSAIDLNSSMLDLFWDGENGGLFLTSRRSEDLLVRAKETHDGAVPSGNSVAMYNMLRLSSTTGDADHSRRASELARALSRSIAAAPTGHTMLLVALDYAVGPAHQVVVVGRPGADDTRAMLDALASRFLPNHVVILKNADDAGDSIVEIAGFTEHHRMSEGKATAYVCVNQACRLPTTRPERMLEVLTGRPG